MNNITAIIILITIFIFSLPACKEKKVVAKADFIIGTGQMPDIVTGKGGNLHLVFGVGDSIMYASSGDKGASFSRPSLVAVLPGLFSFATRGPQIAASGNEVIITAATSKGNIYSYYRENGSWKQGRMVNDVDTIAKEGLIALSADGQNAFAVWLDLRGNRRNKIYGASSGDGGRSWSKNKMIYTSPDTSVCQCCKPSVIIRENNVYVMFRNWLKGDRDLYLISSSDAGASFGQAQKLGAGTWELDGCPMDGGSLAVNKNGEVQTVWRRKAKIYAAIPGMPENEIGEGRSCTMGLVNNRNVYAWSANEEVICSLPGGQKEVLGKGGQPVVTAPDNEHVICVWEEEKQIHAAVLVL